MTIIHAQSAVASGGSSEFAPTILGRIAATGLLVLGNGEDYVFGGGSSCDAKAAIWLLRTGGDVYIRCGCHGTGNVVAEEAWYNEAGADQGDPGRETGAGTNIFQLNSDVDSVNIYAAALDNNIQDSPAGLQFSAYGTFTDDDKSTFFLPTADVKYGREVDCESAGPQGTRRARITVQVTFRKAEFEDLTISFLGEALGDWESDS